jgi:hypothetical protein
LEHLRFQVHHPLMDLIFDLHKRRFGVRSPPLFDVTQNLLTLLQPGLFVHRFFHALFFIRDAHIVSACGSPDYPQALQNCRGHPLSCIGEMTSLDSRFGGLFSSSF